MSCLAFICFFPQRVRAMDASWYSDGLYHIVDYSGTDAEYGSYDTYEKALKDFDAAAQIYQNAAIVKDGTVLKAERAFVLFNRDDACSLDLEMEYSDHSTTTVNGCYGIDAAYISTSDDGQTVNLLLSGAELGASISDVTILPIENSSVRLSTYSVIDGHLYHQIKNEIDDENYYDEIDLGPAPSFLNAEGIFLSYDGHYFYNSDSMWRWKMICMRAPMRRPSILMIPGITTISLSRTARLHLSAIRRRSPISTIRWGRLVSSLPTAIWILTGRATIFPAASITA